MTTARDALDRLREGNRRFVAGRRSEESAPAKRRDELVAGQEPFAVVLGCSDSRVPAEIVFDQGLGDLFVIRVAGNIVAPSQIGSVEFAVAQFGTPLVVVLGHSDCGAVAATLDRTDAEEEVSPHLRSIVDRIWPSIEPLLSSDPALDPAALKHAAVRANVRASALHLRHGSDLLEGRIRSGDLVVVGAEYSLQTGEVEFFDGVPAAV